MISGKSLLEQILLNSIMKKFTLMLLLVSLLSCTNEERTDSTSELDDPIQQFTQVISKVIYNEGSVRQFIKTKALEKFDNDYEILYSCIKEEMIGEYSFRDHICRFGGESVVNIDEDYPLLTILVPDMSMFTDFNADNWDISDCDIAVTSEFGEKFKTVYYNGDILGQLGGCDVPLYPILVIKNNERVQLVPTTKGTERKYEFIDDVFDPACTKADGIVTRGIKKEYSEIEYPVSPATDFIPKSKLSEYVINAWQEFKDNDTAAHRDYIYYGMRKNKNYGSLNKRYMEQLLRIKLENTNCMDQNDPTLQSEIKSHSSLTYDDIVKKMWSDGQLEIYLTLYKGVSDGSEKVTTKNIAVKPSELFDIDKASLEFKHKTKFHPLRNYKYTLSVNDLVPKWFYPENVFLEDWDISQESCVLNYCFEELDGEERIARTIEVSNTYATNFKYDLSQTTSGDFKIGDKIGFGIKTVGSIGGSKDKQHQIKSQYTYSTTRGSDDLGSITWRYVDPIILEESTENGVAGYNVLSKSSGSISITVLPVKR